MLLSAKKIYNVIVAKEDVGVGDWLKPEYYKEGITGLPDLSTHLRGRPKIEEEEKT